MQVLDVLCFTLTSTTGACQTRGCRPASTSHSLENPGTLRRCYGGSARDGRGAGRKPRRMARVGRAWAAPPTALVQECQVLLKLSVRSLSWRIFRWHGGFLRLPSGAVPEGSQPPCTTGVLAVGLCRESPSGRWAPFMNEVYFVVQMQDVKLGWDPNPASSLGTATSCLFPFGQPATVEGSITDRCVQGHPGPTLRAGPGPTALPQQEEVGGFGPIVGLGRHPCVIWV